MARRMLLCGACSERYPVGDHTSYSPTSYEPVEWTRLVMGHARLPTQEQRTIYVDGVSFTLDADYYECDRCDTPISEGDSVGCLTIWRDTLEFAPLDWEQGFIQPVPEEN